MNHPVLIVIMRYVHIISVILLVGGLMFNFLGQRVARKVLDSDAAQTFINTYRKWILNIQWAAMLGLIVSGLYTWFAVSEKYKQLGKIGNILIGTKILLAMTVFCVIWMRWSKLIQSDKTAMMINIHLAAIIIFLGAVLRYYDWQWVLTHAH